MTKEGALKKKVKEVLHKFKILPFKDALAMIGHAEHINGYYNMPASNGYGEAGMGDFLCCIRGKYVEIETKTKEGRLRGIQLAHGQVIESSQGVYMVIKDESSLPELVSYLEEVL